MYMYAPTGIADALGQATQVALTPALQTWLKQVPERHQVPLAIAALHPKPTESAFWFKHTFVIGEKRHTLVDEILFSGIPEIDVVKRLKRISADFQNRDPDWRRMIADVITLRREYTNTLSVLGRRPEALDPLPLTALVPARGESETGKLTRLGLSTAKEKFPPRLAERMRQTPAFDVHFYTVGRWLKRYAEVLQTKDPDFKRRVNLMLSLRKQP